MEKFSLQPNPPESFGNLVSSEYKSIQKIRHFGQKKGRGEGGGGSTPPNGSGGVQTPSPLLPFPSSPGHAHAHAYCPASGLYFVIV